MQRRTLELGVGVFVALGLAALTFLAFRVGNLSGGDIDGGYRLKARFDNIGSLRVKAPVTVAGVRVGRVSDIGFDPQDFQAVVTLTIDPRYNGLPQDTGASILTAGLLGEQYIGLEPGGAPESLREGDELKLTQSALVLEQIIGQFLYSKAEGDQDAGQSNKK